MAQRRESQDLTELITRPLDAAARNVRAATVVAPVRPAYAAGFRAALATIVPLLAASVLLLFLFKRAERQPAAVVLTRA